jgi:putative transposase
MSANVKEGLLALAVGAGRQVMQVLMDEPVTALAGPRGKHDRERVGVCHGTEASSVVLGSRQVPVLARVSAPADGPGTLEISTGSRILGRALDSYR